MEFARTIALAMVICFWGGALFGGLAFINLVMGRLAKASEFMIMGLLMGGSWQIFAALLIPFSSAHGLYTPSGAWNQTITFHGLNGVLTFVLAFIVRFFQLRIK